MALPEDMYKSVNGQSRVVGFDWGWFEDFDKDEDGSLSDNNAFLSSGESTLSLSNSPLPNAFSMCRTLPPLRDQYDTPYHRSKYPWLRVLPSHGYIKASIQISDFRVVETTDLETEHAEYLIQMRLDGRYFSRWRRFSAIARFVGLLKEKEFQRSLGAWQVLEAGSRWFYRLEIDYLHRRCQLLEEFAHALLAECSNAHLLAELLEYS